MKRGLALEWQEAVKDFFSQPFGVFGSVCIMAAVTCFNSVWLKNKLSKQLSTHWLNLMLNGLNTIGGISLLINAIIRNEIVWKVLEVYFIVISLKGFIQELKNK
ncbi:MAG: hypothetical protein AB8G05_10285 [Oligoflexales bacterium]